MKVELTAEEAGVVQYALETQAVRYSYDPYYKAQRSLGRICETVAARIAEAS
ncbi:hypothetical protein [Mycolicibacterium palauense]|uniref:hypothetical protein n=1 Tax=Mycolicibacterium palauense TaxID=2034511 RepID=UPI00159BB42C|nr:hypothetical protein [Mycolicibacterium palauense]